MGPKSSNVAFEISFFYDVTKSFISFHLIEENNPRKFQKDFDPVVPLIRAEFKQYFALHIHPRSFPIQLYFRKTISI
jgi:hypothetical protein